MGKYRDAMHRRRRKTSATYASREEAEDGGRYTAHEITDVIDVDRKLRRWVRGLEENPEQVAEIEAQGLIPVEVTQFGHEQRQYIGREPYWWEEV